MAYVDIPPPGITIGSELIRIPGNAATITGTIATNKAYGSILIIPKTGTISKFYVRIGAASDPQDLRLVASTVDSTTFLPTETLWSAGAEAVLSGYSANTSYWVTLDTPISVTRGQLIAFYLEFDSTVGSAGIVNNSTHFYRSGRPLAVTKSSTDVWSVTGGSSGGAVEYDDGSRPHCGSFPFNSHSSGTFSINSSPDEMGNRFILPFDCKIGGALLMLDGNSTNEFAIRLYDSANTLLASATLTRNIAVGTAGISYCLFSTEQEITAGEVYRIVLAPTTTSTVHYKYINIESGLAECWPSGENLYYTERVDAGSWTDMDTRIFRLLPIISAIDTGAAAAVVNEELSYAFAS